jgi:hypothetical protein
MPDQFMSVVTASNEPEAAVLLGRLQEAGIRCVADPPMNALGRLAGRRHSVLVAAADVEKARDVLREDEGGFDEDELARLSEEAGRQAMEGDGSRE